MKKSKLKDFDIVELRNGDRFIKLHNILYGPGDVNGQVDYDCINLKSYNENLLMKDRDYKNQDIMKVKQFDGDNTMISYTRNFNVLHKLDNGWTWIRTEILLNDNERETIKNCLKILRGLDRNYITVSRKLYLDSICIEIQYSKEYDKTYSITFDLVNGNDYENLKLSQEYTLVELGIFEELRNE